MKIKIISIIVFLVFYISSGIASDLIEVLPLTNKIVMLRFNDGYATYHKIGQPRNSDRVFVEPLNTSQASLPATYLLESKNDSNYLTPKNPAQVGRKTKGTEFIWMCQSWTKGCINTSPDHVDGNDDMILHSSRLPVTSQYEFNWWPSESNLASGTYFYRIQLDNEPGLYHT